ncbi:hypothetical protein KPH14_011864 [Odynerus spinipes]|uniref:Uncharacterized protein n=1 Tax=Odynerus spinipes TaxID=1348599 RepID=A0AAD9RDU7_9HYME|nr:hypothetical protein KPH14_011864 [Odynerus spinipes]
MHTELRVQEVTAEVDAFIVSDEYLKRDLIVGRDFLDQDHVVMIKKQRQLILRRIENALDVFEVADKEESSEEFDFGDVTAEEKQEGAKMAHVDALSRNPLSVGLEIGRIDLTEADWI